MSGIYQSNGISETCEPLQYREKIWILLKEIFRRTKDCQFWICEKIFYGFLSLCVLAYPLPGAKRELLGFLIAFYQVCSREQKGILPISEVTKQRDKNKKLL